MDVYSYWISYGPCCDGLADTNWRPKHRLMVVAELPMSCSRNGGVVRDECRRLPTNVQDSELQSTRYSEAAPPAPIDSLHNEKTSK